MRIKTHLDNNVYLSLLCSYENIDISGCLVWPGLAWGEVAGSIPHLHHCTARLFCSRLDQTGARQTADCSYIFLSLSLSGIQITDVCV